jgi:WD40 repeat protein/serine/threonine protein kinase
MSDNDYSAADPFGPIAEEFVEAFRQGKRPSVEEFARRYPAHANEIREMLPALVLMEMAKTTGGPSGQPQRAQASSGAPPLSQLGDYLILREVGRGGMGVVYEAQQLSLGRHVAIKVLPSHSLLDPRHLRRFQREARAAARLHHTNIVPVFGVGEQDGLHYYVMQFIPGLGLDVVLAELRRLRQPLDKRTPKRDDAEGECAEGTRALSASAVARNLLSGEFRRPAEAGTETFAPAAPAPEARAGPAAPVSAADTSAAIHLPGQTRGSTLSDSGSQYWQSVARIGVQVAEALSHAASQGVLHRDIKPSNLLLDDTGNVWVTDFGLAKSDADGDNLTHTGDFVGTMRYMAPERFNGQGDLRSDLYSLGLTLYELLVLRPAFDESDRNKLVKEVMHGEPVRPCKINRAVPRDLETVVLKAIARDPSHRYQSPAEMAEDLKRFIEDRPVRARRVSTAERFRRWCRRNPTLACMSAAVVLALAAGTGVSYLKYLEAERQKGIAQLQQARAEAGEREARELRVRADTEAEVTRQNLYYAQMHLAHQAWREHRGLPHQRELLANWLPADESPDRRCWEWFYLNALSNQNVCTITEAGRSWRPSTVAWHAASNRLAEGTGDGLIRIWDVGRGQTSLILRATGPGEPYHAFKWLAWSPDGTVLAAAFRDKTVHLLETRGGREVRILRGHTSVVRTVVFSSDGKRLACWEEGGDVRIWDVGTGRLNAKVCHPAIVMVGAWSADDKLLASGHTDGTVTVSGTGAGDRIVTLRGHAAGVDDIAWGPDNRIVSTSRDFTARVWDPASGKELLGPLRHGHEILSVVWSADGKTLATGSADETIKIWDAATARELVTLLGHVTAVSSLCAGPDGKLASGSVDGNVKIWGPVRDQESDVLPGSGVRTTSVSWSPDGKRLASGYDDGTIRIRARPTGEEILRLKGHDGSKVQSQFGLIRSLAWSPDGSLLASAGLDGTAKVWDVARGEAVFVLPAGHGAVWAVAWSPDGTRLAAACHDGTICLAEGLTRAPVLHSWNAHQGRARGLAWSPRGDRLASTGWDGLVKVWDSTRGVELVSLRGRQGHTLFAVAWSPDGGQLASAGGDRLVTTWDAATGRQLFTMGGHNDWVDAVAWSPDGTRLASAGLDNSVRVWDPRTGEETCVLRGGTGMFHDLAWHPDGAQIAAAGSDGQVRLWDATRGFERDSTPRAWPFIERRLASETARCEDLLAFARTAFSQKRFARAAGLWAAAFASDPKGFDDVATPHRYAAARAAALAAAGQSRGEPPPDDTAKAALRRQALEWLKAELAVRDRMLEENLAQERAGVVPNPSAWKKDDALAGVRDPAALAKLPPEEQQAFARLWADVDGMDSALLRYKSAGQDLLLAAALQAWFGQDEELARTRDRALRVARSDSADARIMGRAVRICSLRPSDEGTRKSVLDFARRAVQLGKEESYFPYVLIALGMAEYRSGNYAEADAALLSAERLGKDSYHVSVTSAYYRAMSQFRQGREAEARDLAARTAVKMKPLPADDKKPLADNASADDLVVWMAHKEAKALIPFEREPPANAKNEKR